VPHAATPLAYALAKSLTVVLQHLPFYRIFVADARAPRDGRHIEVVGHYDPLPGTVAA
jgi:Ribosomal protein S16